MDWSKLTKAEKVELIKKYWVPGSSARDLATRIGATSRSAIIGFYFRHREDLRDFPLQGNPPRLTPEEKRARKIARDRARYHGKRFNVIKLHIPNIRRPLGDRITSGLVPVKTMEVSPLRVVSSNVDMMVNDYLARNGARRFERGAVTEYTALANYLREHGYELKAQAKSRTYSLITACGKKRSMTWAGVISMVDKLRIEEGKEPFIREAI